MVRGSVMKFNVMPKHSFLKEDLIKIADYMYDKELERREWFNKYYGEERQIASEKGWKKE